MTTKPSRFQRSGKRLSFLKLRNEIIQGDLPQWVKETPCHIRQNAVFEIQNGEGDADMGALSVEDDFKASG